MKDLQLFQNEQFGQVRVIDKDGEPWFVAADVCAALDLDNVTEALRGLDDDEKITLTNPEGNPRAGIPHQMNFINEPGLYSLVLRSRKPEAKAFKRWICHEVLPAIHKHGGYLTPAKVEEALLNPDTIIRLATELKQARAERELLANRQIVLLAEKRMLESKVEADRPKVIFADAVDASPNCILVRELARYLQQNGVDIGQNRLFEQLRERGYLIKQQGSDYNQPTQRSMEMGLFEVKKWAFTHSDGRVESKVTTKVTGKGQRYFVNKFLSRPAA